MDFKFVYFVYFMFYIQSTKAIGEDAILISVFKEGNLPGNLTQIPGDLDTRLTSVSGITSQTYTFLNSDLRILSIACTQGNDTSFLYEVSTKSIYRLEPTSGSSMRYYVLHSGISLVEGEITYDWLNRNLYWTDGKFQWIILQPAYALENAMYTVVVDRNLTMPYAITVDPNKGFLFWSDIATNPVIERSNLAGNNRQAIVTKSLSFPNSLVADETTESLFWVDHIRDTIETCSYSGGNRRLLRRLSSTQFTSLALYKDILCVSDATHKRFTCHRKTSGDDTFYIQGFKGTIWALALYDSTNRSIPSSPCQSKSCEHICVAAVGGVAECICKEGFTLNQDGRTCSHVHGLYGKGVLISNNTHICMLEVRIMSQFDHEPLCIFSKVGAKITHLETDTNRSLIFFSDDAQKEILIHNRINQANSTLTSTSTVSGLAYDWINENLFWTESDTGRVRVVSLTTRSSLIVFNGLSSPKELTIDPHNSTLYWVENDTSGKKIQSGKTDGTQKQTVISGSFSSAPYGLYFNTLTNRLYWGNSGALRSSLGNGTNIKSHFSIGSAKHLSIYKGYVIWATDSPDIRSSRLSSSQTEFIKPLSLFGSITGMVIFDPSIQRTEKGPCEDANGGCQEICVATQPGRTCQCSLGFTLQSDQTSCSSTPIYNDFLLTTDNSHNKVYQISLVNKNVTALDLPNLNSAVGIAYNSKTKMVVWSEIQTGQIRQSLLTGENSSIIFSLGFAFADRLAIDFSTNNIYFSQISHLGVGGSIRVVRDGVSAKTIVPSMSSPRAIALYPSKGYLFFTDHQTISSHISRCNMDGSSKTTLVSVSTKWPNGLALDYATDRLYSTDGYHNKIQSTDLNGGDRREILTDSSSHMMSIIVGGPYIYYTAWSKQIITKVNKNTNQQETWMEHNAEFGRLDSLDIYMGRTHPVNSLCSSQNGQCSTYCLPTTTGRTCACEDGVTLQSDGRTCQGVTQCSSSIPNGFLPSNCLRFAGLKCDYYCSSTYQKNASIQDITCESTGSWNMPLQYLCNPIKCDMAIPNGTFTSNCDGSLNNFCQYNCDTGYQANPSYSNILCSMPGVWSPLTDQLCSRIQCPSSIPNGGLSSCNRYVGDVCSYQCNNGYRQNTSISSLTCLATGQWNVQVDTICQAIGEDAIFISVFKEGSLPGNLTQIYGNLDTRLTSASIDVISRKFNYFNSNLKIVSIACAQGNDTSFLYEISTRGIYRLEQTSGTTKTHHVLHPGISFVEAQITYDWLNKNLYWTDGKFQWIILQPAYALESTMYKVVVDRNLAMPIGLTVDPNKGFLFWSDIATNPVIERSNLAGNNRQTVVSKSLSFPNSLVADETTESLFWTDMMRETIETCSYTGENRRSLVRIVSSRFASLALYQDILCVSDAGNKRFTCHRKTSGDTIWNRNGFNGSTWALALYDSTDKSIPVSPCQSKTCEHICVSAVGGVAECICKEGFTLNQDGRTCSDTHGLHGKAVLISNNTHICMLEVRIMSPFDHDPQCILNQVGTTITHMETDANGYLIFFSDNAKKEILIHNRINRVTSTFTSTSLVSGLAYDWINKNLFWSESDTGRIRVVSLTTRSSSIVLSGLSSPKELTIDPHNSTLYWVENDTNGKKVQSGSTDGTQKQTIISGSCSSDPNGLYFNTLTNRLYWEVSGSLRSSLGNGTNIKNHFSIGIAKRLSIYKGYAIWTTATPDIRSAKLSSSSTEFIKSLSFFGSITGMVIFDPSIQKTQKGPCEDANGGCQEICVATQSGRTCQCSLGFTLQSDQTSCSSTPINNDFLLTTDNTHNKIYQISLANKSVTALDLPNLNSPTGIAYNPKSSMVVWSEIVNGQIRQAFLTGENASIIYNLGFAFADSLVIDISTNNIYFSQVHRRNSSGSIKVVREGVSPNTIVQNLNFPRAVALYPSKGYLFFTDIHTNNSHISRCNMDGSSKTTLVSISTKSPTGLALDYTADRLYWTDGYHDKIESIDLNGANRRAILEDSGSYMMDIVLGGSYLYYMAWSRQIITKVNKNTNQKETWMAHNAEFGRLDSLDIYMGITHPVNSLCSSQNGQCSTYCLPTASGRRCACEDGVTLQSDGRTCQ